MGLLDGLLGSMMGGQQMPGAEQQMPGAGQRLPGAYTQNPLLQLALQILQQNGGIEGILRKFQQAGYGPQAQSWISTGRNLPIDPNVLAQIFGRGQLGQIAQQMGMSNDEASGGLAQTLPQVIDEMTPQGQVPDNNSDLVNRALEILRQSQMR
jgi:uncharacterized protein YidB (DUF937 family)